MKRDIELIRKILLYLEQTPKGLIRVENFAKDLSVDEEIIKYQINLLYQAGFIYGTVRKAKPYGRSEKAEHIKDDVLSVTPYEMTWQGHEYLETIRDPEVWEKTKKCAEEMGNFGVDTIKAIATGFITTKIKQHTGVDI